ncbi:hypothetical protein T439DRAFT_383754 [Meredithblackwellia eburnea MCA 4105]
MSDETRRSQRIKDSRIRQEEQKEKELILERERAAQRGGRDTSTVGEEESWQTGAQKVPARKKQKSLESLPANEDASAAVPPALGVFERQKLMANMPFDILVSICFQLDVADILNLARTSHFLRNSLLSTAGQSIWKSERLFMKVPIFHGWSELKFALLLFGKNCWCCDGNKSGTLDLNYRARICYICLADLAIDSGNLVQQFGELHPQLHDCTLALENKNVLKQDVEAFNRHLIYYQEEEEIILEEVKSYLAIRGKYGEEHIKQELARRGGGPASNLVKARQATLSLVYSQTSEIREALRLSNLAWWARDASATEFRLQVREVRRQEIESHVRNVMKDGEGWTDEQFVPMFLPSLHVRSSSANILSGSFKAAKFDEVMRLHFNQAWTFAFVSSDTLDTASQIIKAALLDSLSNSVALSKRDALHTYFKELAESLLPQDQTAATFLKRFDVEFFIHIPAVVFCWEAGSATLEQDISDILRAEIFPDLASRTPSTLTLEGLKAARAIHWAEGKQKSEIDLHIFKNLAQYDVDFFHRATSLFFQNEYKGERFLFTSYEDLPLGSDYYAHTSNRDYRAIMHVLNSRGLPVTTRDLEGPHAPLKRLVTRAYATLPHVG